MIDAVFISDLHLHPDNITITKRFNAFLNWAAIHTKTVYILGDFFHVWPGDDALDAWSNTIASQLKDLATQGVMLYFMHGNRDFLLGKRFAKLAGLTILNEPSVIKLNQQSILLVHGDRYCTKDRSHQWLRRITRNAFFPKLFLLLPYLIREKLVNKVRDYSEANRNKPAAYMEVISSAMTKHMQQLNVKTLIHGHTHQPGLTSHHFEDEKYQQYVLSDWDDNPHLLCYHETDGFKFKLMPEI